MLMLSEWWTWFDTVLTLALIAGLAILAYLHWSENHPRRPKRRPASRHYDQDRR